MQKLSKSNLLYDRLWREVAVRNRFSAWVHLHVMIMAVLFCQTMHKDFPRTLTSFGFIVLGNAFRMIIFKKIAKEGTPERSMQILHHCCLFSIGLGWGLFWYDTHLYYGRFSIQGLFAFLALSAFISGAVPANAPRPWGYIWLALPMAIIPTSQFLMLGGSEATAIAYFVMFYLSFNLYQLKVGYQHIRQFIEKDLTVTQERDKLQTLFDAVPGFVCIVDKDLRYVSMNETAQEFFNLRNYYQQHISIPNPDSEFVRFVTKFMDGDKFTSVTEVKYELNPGNSHAILRIQKLKPPHGGAMIVAIPIDELVDTREKIKSQEAKAFYSAKLISLGEMAAGIAHEINNPLAIILGSSDQIMREIKKPEPQLPRVEILTEKIQKTVERISLIIKSLRILARNGERDPYVPFKLDAAIEPSLEISRQRLLEESIELIYESPTEDIMCVGQEIQLSQVMMNLLSNAIDAALDGPTPRWVKLEIKNSIEFAEVRVQDSGYGIPKEIRNKIMEPFFTTKAINKGTGLGLSISKSIMEQHGGTLVLDESALNTTFVIRIRRSLVTV